MERRNFFKNASLFGLGATLLGTIDVFSQESGLEKKKFNKKARNIIFMVSDGMSIGTLNMADLYLKRTTGKGTNWLNLYRENKVSRGLMDMASASSIVTDSAAASSSWGGGHRVENGKLNFGTNGEVHTPIWQKFKKAGKKAGCVTTVPITHATPAGFLISAKNRGSMEDIAELYLEQNFDVLMGGGHEVFAPDKRKDAKDMYLNFENGGYQVVKNRTDLLKTSSGKPILGVFHEDGLPYTIDRNSSPELQERIPTLAEMTYKAIEHMQSHPEGFVLQVEGGKVDWAAHANDIGGLIYDQVAFDEALAVALDFAEKDGNTLVIITTDHGNSNPGVVYGKEANENFDRIQKFKQTNEWILNGITSDFTVEQVIERIEYANGYKISNEDAKEIFGYYHGLEKREDGLYNYKKLPFKLLSDIQKKFTNVGWIGDNHSADYVEIAMYGPGQEIHPNFLINTDLHYFMLKVAGVKE
jgi:alkaline phosphatase